MSSASASVVDTIRVVSVVDSSFMANIDGLVESAFSSGLSLALVACTISAGIVMLGVAVSRAISV